MASPPSREVTYAVNQTIFSMLALVSRTDANQLPNLPTTLPITTTLVLSPTPYPSLLPMPPGVAGRKPRDSVATDVSVLTEAADRLPTLGARCAPGPERMWSRVRELALLLGVTCHPLLMLTRPEVANFAKCC